MSSSQCCAQSVSCVGLPQTVTVTLTGGGAFGVAPHNRTVCHVNKLAALPRTVKLGRVAPRHNKPVPRLARYFDAPRSAPPAKVDWTPKAMDSLTRMYLNDQEGDCVIAGKYHALGVATGNDAGTALVVSDSEIQQVYNRLKAGPGDSGCVITDVLDAWVKTGLPVNGTPHKADGYVSVDWSNKDMVKAAIAVFGFLTLGINLPQAWASAAVWDVTNSRIVGGHDVTAVGYDEMGVYVSSWGRVYLITWNAFTSHQWVGECYAVLIPEWYGSDLLAPSGIKLDALKTDLARLQQGGIPDVTPPAPPAPPQPPAPPAPPPAPTYPNYVMDMSGVSVHLPMFGDCPLMGRVTLTPVQVAALGAGFGWPNWLTMAKVWAVIALLKQDGPQFAHLAAVVLATVADVKSGDIAAIIAELESAQPDFEKVIADIRKAFNL